VAKVGGRKETLIGRMNGGFLILCEINDMHCFAFNADCIIGNHKKLDQIAFTHSIMKKEIQRKFII